MEKLSVEDIDFYLIKKPIKRMWIRIKDADLSVYVSAPLFVSKRSVKSFVKSKKPWIVQAQARAKQRNNKFKQEMKNLERSFVNGEEILLWGEVYSLKILKSTKNKIVFNKAEKTCVMCCRRQTKPQAKLQYLSSYYKDELINEAEVYIKHYSRLLGCFPKKVYARFAKTVWGSCNHRDKKIMLNANLAKLDKKYLEYIIVHELCHLKQHNHGEKFKNLESKLLPNWREIDNELKKHRNITAQPYLISN